MNSVFISYAKEDAAFAEMLAGALQKAAFSVWWDRHIPPGKTWDDVIGHALDEAACVIVLWSGVSVQSRWVREEAEKAASRGCLIPALVDKVDPPFGFGRIQAADLSAWRGGEHDPEFADLLRAVADLVKTTPGGSAADERVSDRVNTEPEPRQEEGRTELMPPAREEQLANKRYGKSIGTYVKAVLAVIGLIAVGYFGLEYSRVADPQILGFRAVPASTEPGQPVTLSWQTRDASQVQLADIGQVALTGQHRLSPRESRNYTLIATNKRGRSCSSTIQVTVTPPPRPNWIRIVHRGDFLAKFFLQWEGQTKLWESGEKNPGYEVTVPLPPDVKTVLLNAQANTRPFKLGWKRILRKTETPVQRTYTVTGNYVVPRWSASPPLK